MSIVYIPYVCIIKRGINWEYLPISTTFQIYYVFEYAVLFFYFLTKNSRK